MKRLIWVLLILIGILSATLLSLLETTQFATLFQKGVVELFLNEPELEIHFTEFKIQLFPLKLTILNPSFCFKKNLEVRNTFFLMKLERIEIALGIWQLFSKYIHAKEIALLNGEVVWTPPLLEERTPQAQIYKTPLHQVAEWIDSVPKDWITEVKRILKIYVRTETVRIEGLNWKVVSQATQTSKGTELKGRINYLKFIQNIFDKQFGFLLSDQENSNTQVGFQYSLEFEVDSLSSNVFPPYGFQNKEAIKLRGLMSLTPEGLKLNSLSLRDEAQKETRYQLTGEINHFLNPKTSWNTELNLQFMDHVQDWTELLKAFKLKQPLAGLVSGKLQLEGDLKRLVDTLKLAFYVQGKDLQFGPWKVQEAEGVGSWKSTQDPGGEWLFSKMNLTAPEKPRVGGFQPGSGGKVSIQPFRWVPAKNQEWVVPITFDRAHLHWLGAAGLVQLYPLDFRVTGTALIQFKPRMGKEIRPKLTWNQDESDYLTVKVDWALEDFQFDNQRYLKNKPLSILFKIPKIYCQGQIGFKQEQVNFKDFKVKLGQTDLNLQGLVDFKKGYDLKASGNVLLDEFKEIAQQEIRGNGKVKLHVQGPSSQVLIHIGLDLKNFYYLNLHLGAVQGQLLWDDQRDILHLKHLDWKEDKNRAFIQGDLNFSKPDEQLNVGVQILQAEFSELTQVFSNILKPLTYFPKDISGLVQGNVSIRGGMDNSELIIHAELNGKDIEKWGENFSEMNLKGGYIKGRYFIDRLRLTKGEAQVNGQLSFDPSYGLDWDIQTQGLLLTHWNTVLNFGLPIRGQFEFESHGNGKPGSLRSFSQLKLTGQKLGEIVLPPSRLTLTSNEEGSYWDGFLWGNQLKFSWNDYTELTKLNHFKLSLNEMNLVPFFYLMNPKLIREKGLEAGLSGLIDLKFPHGQLSHATGMVGLSHGRVLRQDQQLALVKPFQVFLNNGNFESPEVFFKGNLGSLELGLRSQHTPQEHWIAGKANAYLQLSLLELLSPNLIQAGGFVKGHWLLKGTWDHAEWTGAATIERGMLQFKGLDSLIESISGVLNFKQNEIVFEKTQAQLGGGPVNLQGRVKYYPDKPSDWMIKGNLNGNRLKVYPFQYLNLKGNLEYQAREGVQRLDGTLWVNSALLKEKVLSKRAGLNHSLSYAHSDFEVQENYFKNLNLNLMLQADRGVWIQNDLFKDLEVKGKLYLLNTIQSPQLAGSIQAVQGKLIFKEHIFQIQNATATFTEGRGMNPAFDLSAVTEVNRIRVQLFASSTEADSLKIQLNSNPNMTESEILSLLAIGLTPEDLKKINASGQAAFQSGEATALLLHALNFNKDFEEKTGFQLQLNEPLNSQQGMSVFKPQTTSDVLVSPQIKIRKKINNRFTLSAGSTVGIGSNKQNQINLDYSVNPNLSISGVFINYGSSDTADTQLNNLNSMGLDFKFIKRFQ